LEAARRRNKAIAPYALTIRAAEGKELIAAETMIK
jgi:hypothetical protein